MSELNPVPAPARPRRSGRRWLPVLLGALTFVVVLAGLGGLVGDWTARNVEMQVLVARIEGSEAAMAALQQEVKDVLVEYQSAEALSVDERAALDRRLAEAAERGRAAVAAAGERVSAVRWLSWHREIGAAQDAYLAHNRAWQEYLARAAEDPAEFGVKQDAVNSTFAAAEDPVRAAVPEPWLFDLRDRVDLIFAEPPPADDGPQQEV